MNKQCILNLNDAMYGSLCKQVEASRVFGLNETFKLQRTFLM
jgi:hypothetical protein